ncbi:helix-turn-helix domain-containing protein [Bifidobacterium sp. SMB2]|uniref:Helix-turn-helix domain-containing protein n=1 Tax=Bifidobacterium saimiriisciurei TaxID=2661627 RepID=A0ABX0C6V3_9BIFI|nr:MULTISPECIES: helix-turn-helix transcriptional regulator [Bifidobacterium]NEG96054.1 helix-turn-helix domain-containing protein [Bifidobacterium sp. SMB2]NEH10868.1 helix-turn-helix domain-containing protein [Bifidobacterium saimiriisciurei]
MTSTDITGDKGIERRRAFGRAVVALRKTRHLSQEQLALDAGLDRSYMGRIERGEQSMGLDNMWAVCDAMGISMLDLFQQEYVERRDRGTADNGNPRA